MTSFAFNGDEQGKTRFERTIASLLSFAIAKLNGKGAMTQTSPSDAGHHADIDRLLTAIFANTLGFAGKMLAAAFWNLEGVALKMLRLLPAVKKQHVLRILSEAGVEDW